MSRSKKSRKRAWFDRFPGASMNGKLQTSKGTIIEYVGYLSEDQLQQILKILFPKKNVECHEKR